MLGQFLKTGALWIVAGGCVTLAASREQAVGEFDIPDVLPLNEPQLAALRAWIETDESARRLADDVAERARPVLDIEPHPLEVIHYEGLVNTDPRRIATVAQLSQMADAGWLFRHWQTSDDPRAAEALRRLIRGWTGVYRLTGNDVNENKFFPLLVAYEALRETFREEEHARIDAWVRELGTFHLNALRQAERYSNRFGKSVRLVAICGRILDEAAWTETAVEGVREFVRQSLRADGTSYDLEHRDSLTYHGSSLKAGLELALVLGPQGHELYTWTSPQGSSLKACVDYLVPYATGEKQHREWVHTKVELDRRRAAAGLEKYRTGRLYEPRQALGVLQAASAFDADLLPLVRELAGAPEARFPTWRTLCHAAFQAAR